MSKLIVIDTEPTINPDTGNFTAADIDNEPTTCNICQEDISDGIIKTPCNHEFCNNCFFKWLQEKPNCPLCRKEFVNEDIMKNIMLNREELSVLSSEIQYNRMRSLRVKRRMNKRKRTCGELLLRQVGLREMLQYTRKNIVAERDKLKELRSRSVTTRSKKKKEKKEDEEFVELMINTDISYENSFEAPASDTEEEISVAQIIINQFTQPEEILDESSWNNSLLDVSANTEGRSRSAPRRRQLFPSPDESSTSDSSISTQSSEEIEVPASYADIVRGNHTSQTQEAPEPIDMVRDEEPSTSPPPIPETLETTNSPFEFGMEPVNFDELFPINRDSSGNVIFRFGEN